jgi:hypothetical protein
VEGVSEESREGLGLYPCLRGASDKYEVVYLKAYESVAEAKQSLDVPFLQRRASAQKPESANKGSGVFG